MKRRIFYAAGALVCLGWLVTGCGQASTGTVPPPVIPTPHVKTTPVPSPLVAFASYSDPILRTSIAESRDLLNKMTHWKTYDLGDICSLVGSDLSNSHTALRGGSAPNSIALANYNTASAGFKLVLSATDECGMASDINSKTQMKVAATDLRNGLVYLARAEYQLSQWQSNKV